LPSRQNSHSPQVQCTQGTPVANLQMIDRGTFFYDPTGNFVPENQGSLGDRNESRPISISNVQVSVADATRFNLDQNIVCAGLWLVDFFQGQRRFEFAQDGSFHNVYLNESGMHDSVLCLKRANSSDLDSKWKGFPRTVYGLAPRKKNSTALRTRSVSL